MSYDIDGRAERWSGNAIRMADYTSAPGGKRDKGPKGEKKKSKNSQDGIMGLDAV